MLKDRMSVSLEEQETNITLSPMDKGTALIYTCVPNVIRWLYKWADEYPDQVVIRKDDGWGVDAEIPAEWVSFKPRKKRVMSEEQRAAAAARLAAARERKQ